MLRLRVFTLAGRTRQRHPGVGQLGLECLAVVVLVADQCHRSMTQSRSGGQHGGSDAAFIGFGVDQRPPQRQPVEGTDRVQSQAPREPCVGGAVAIQGPAGQLGRFAVSQERPHSTGVGSTTSTSSPAIGVSDPS